MVPVAQALGHPSMSRTTARAASTDCPWRRNAGVAGLDPEVENRSGCGMGIATLLVAAIVAPNVGYLISGNMPFIEDATGMSAVAIVIALVAASVISPGGLRGPWGRTAAVTGIGAACSGSPRSSSGSSWAA